jgi:hypothetical protein
MQKLTIRFECYTQSASSKLLFKSTSDRYSLKHLLVLFSQLPSRFQQPETMLPLYQVVIQILIAAGKNTTFVNKFTSLFKKKA